MPTLKTSPNNKSVEKFIDTVENLQRKTDCLKIKEIMDEVTGLTPQMWGDSIVGYGSYHYVYESGREGDWFLTGFSPRKQALTIYVMAGFKQYDKLMEQLGKFKTGSSCLYVKKLEDVNEATLRELIATSVEYIKERYE